MKRKFKGSQKYAILSFVALFSMILFLGILSPTPFTPEAQITDPNTSLVTASPYDLWLDNGTAICTENLTQEQVAITTDGSGGAIICWADERFGNYDIYAQRIDVLGQNRWFANGTLISSGPNDQTNPQIISDGAGGAIITWQDWRISNFDIYAQRVDMNGTPQWAGNGQLISNASNNQGYPKLASDGSSGAVIAWQDMRGGSFNDIYAQWINAAGVVQWTVNGAPVSTAINQQTNVDIITTASGEPIITWMDYRSTTNYDIYAQRLNLSGGQKWTTNGVPVSTFANNQMVPSIITDDADGAIIVWEDYRAGNYDIYAQRLDSSGAYQWIANGTPICTAGLTQVGPAIMSDGMGGAVLAWEDFRSGANRDVYAQTINFTGQVQWTSNGVAICTAARNQESIQLASDTAGGTILVWDDLRNTFDRDIYTQLINSTGHSQWAADGERICTLLGDQIDPQITEDLAAGAIIAWPDNRSGNPDIYAQHIGVKGILTPTTDAPVYTPGEFIQVQANFMFSNGTPVNTATIGFMFLDPDMQQLAMFGNFTDSNGISTASFFVELDYLDGNYTIYVTAVKGFYTANVSVLVYVNTTHIEIVMYPPILIGDIFDVDAYYRFTNGTPIAGATVGFTLRNASGVLQFGGDVSDGTGHASWSFGTDGYGEGWYEMYVTAVKGNYSKIANYTFFITAYNGPIILDPTLTPDPPAYNESGQVNVSIGVAPGYANITDAKLSYFNGTGWYNLTMTNSTPVDGRGFAYYDASIPPQHYGLQISYKIWSIDSLGNQTWNDNGGQLFNYTVSDRWGPTVDTLTRTTPVAYNTTVNVTVHVAEDPLSPTNASGVASVTLYYQPDLVPVPVPMSQLNGTLFDGYWTALIPTLNYATNVDLWVEAFDQEGKDTTTGVTAYVVDDFWGPTISNVVLNNAPIAYNMTANVTCRVQEDQVPTSASGIDDVILSYHNGIGWNNLTMSWIAGNPSFDGIYQATIPEIQYGVNVLYYIWCNDTAGNPRLDNNSGNAYLYIVDDFTSPNISATIVANAPITYNMLANVTCRITEFSIPTVQSGVDTAILIYRENGGSWINVTMNRYSGNAADGLYSALIPAFDHGTFVEYWIWCNDSAGNTATDDNFSSYYSYIVDDFWGPSISAITLENPPVSYVTVVNITCRVQEPVAPANASGVHTVILTYNDGSGWNNLTMTRFSGDQRDGLYQAQITERAYGTTVQYLIFSNDTVGNPSIDDNSGSYYSYTVDDFWAPSISNIVRLNPPHFYNKTVNVSCQIQEPTAPANAAGVDTVILIYDDGTWNNITMTRYSGDQYDGLYWGEIPEIDYGFFVRYWIWFNDSKGNTGFDNNLGAYYSYIPDDAWGPTISGITILNAPVAYDMQANVSCRVQEPTVPASASGVDTVLLSYNIGAGWVNVTMTRYGGNNYDGQYYGLIPEGHYNDVVQYWIWCNDTKGNTAKDDFFGSNYFYIVDDFTAPNISAITLVNSPITYNMTANVTCRVQEPTTPALASGVQTVILSYFNGTDWNNLTMTRYTGNAWDGYYTAIIPVLNYSTLVQYWILCYDVEGNFGFDDNSSNFYTYNVDDFWGPTISAITVENSPIAYNMTANITCVVQEPTAPAYASGVGNVILNYHNGSDWNNVVMTRYNGDAYNGGYTALIPALTYGTLVQYWIYCEDIATNPSVDNNSGAYYPYTVDDFWGPTIDKPVQNDTVVEYTEVVNITVRVTEPTSSPNASGVEVTSVILSYWGGSSWANLSMTHISGTLFDGNYSATIPNRPYGTEVAYMIYARDIAGNWNLNDNNSNYFNYTVTDVTAPTVNLISPTNESLISAIVQFTIEDIVAPDTDVFNLTVVYQYNSTPWTVHGSYIDGSGNMTWNPGLTTMIQVNISSWVVSSNYTIYVIAQDLRGLVSSPSYIYNITVSNYTGPIVYNIKHTPDPVGYNESVNVSCNILVPPAEGQIDTVQLQYNDGGGWNILAMSNNTPTDFWAIIPQLALGTDVSYWIYANDTKGNTTNADNFGAYYNYTVGDKWAPTISNIIVTNLPITHSDLADVNCRVQEPIGASGVQTVILIYDIGSGWTNVTMNLQSGDNFDGIYDFQIPQASYPTLVRYWIWTNDTAGNPSFDDNASNYYTYTVIDITAPIINETAIVNAPVGDNMTANISCRVWEASNAAGADFVFLYFNNGSTYQVQMILYSGDPFDGLYTALIPQQNYGTYVEFWIWANDTAGNPNIDDNSGNNYSYTVVDFVDPGQVTGLKAEVLLGSNAINLTWTPNGELDLSHYLVFRALTDVGFTPNASNWLDNTTTAMYLDTGLTDGQIYFYIVMATDYSGRYSTPSIIVNGTPRSEVTKGELIEIQANITTLLNFTDTGMLLEITATGSFNLTMDTLNTSYAFAGHALIMDIYINITTLGDPGTINGSMTLILDPTFIASLGGTITPGTFTIYFWNENDSRWEALSTTYYAANNSLVATITHFTVFGAFASLAETPPAPFPIEILIIIIIGAVAGVAIVFVMARRKKAVPGGEVINVLKNRGHVIIQDVAKEFSMSNSQVIDIILTAIGQNEIRGFLANKKKEFITMDKLKDELSKMLEGN